MKLKHYLEQLSHENNFEVKESPIHGVGVFSMKDFESGEFINVHFFKDDKGLVITKFGKNLNHSDKPNAMSKKDSSGYKTYALKKIKNGDEITLDYRVNKELEQPDDF